LHNRTTIDPPLIYILFINFNWTTGDPDENRNPISIPGHQLLYHFSLFYSSLLTFLCNKFLFLFWSKLSYYNYSLLNQILKWPGSVWTKGVKTPPRSLFISLLFCFIFFFLDLCLFPLDLIYFSLSQSHDAVKYTNETPYNFFFLDGKTGNRLDKGSKNPS